jgi:hypothetical protein
MKWLAWLVGLPIAGFAAIFVFGEPMQIGAQLPAASSVDPDEEAAKQRCIRAITSTRDAPIRSYVDKVAYDDRVQKDCRGFKIPPR